MIFEDLKNEFLFTEMSATLFWYRDYATCPFPIAAPPIEHSHSRPTLNLALLIFVA